MNRLLLLLLPALWYGCQSYTGARFFAEGNCPECGPLMTAVLEKLPGVRSAAWDYETSLCTVVYAPARVDADAMQQTLADGGFSTGYFDPDTLARHQLPACCREPVDRRLSDPNPAHP
ncbi:MAG: hypothetical protein OHK0039_16020 [Bacteroidia bacterium]